MNNKSGMHLKADDNMMKALANSLEAESIAAIASAPFFKSVFCAGRQCFFQN